MKCGTFFKFFIGAFLTFSSLTWGAQESPQQFAFEGRLYQTDGSTPLGDVVNFKFQILNQNSSGNPVNDCVLYEETQNGVNLGATAGVFTLAIGSGTGATKRTGSDAGLTLAQIFDNSKAITAPAGQCPAGTYTPSSGSIRRLRVIVTNTATGITETMSPDMTIGSVPHSVVAETLQGLAPADFLKTDGTTAMSEALTFDTWATAGRPSSPAVGSTGFNTTTGYLESWNGSGWVDYSAGSGGGSLSGLTAGRVPFATSGTAVGDDSNLVWNNTTKRLGIGVAAPTEKIDVGGSANIPAGSYYKVDGSAVIGGSVSNHYVLSGTNGLYFYDDIGTNIRMTVLNTGETGIGTSTPLAQLDVSKTNANGTLRVYDQTATTGVTRSIVRAGAGQATTNLFEIQNNAGTVLGSVNSGGFWLQPGAPTAATNQAATTSYVDSAVSGASGNAVNKDGTTQLTGNWNVGNRAVSNISTLSVGSNTAPTGGVAYFNGNVGVGTTTPGENLSIVSADAEFSMQSTATNSFSNMTMKLPASSTGAATLQFQENAVDKGSLGYNAGTDRLQLSTWVNEPIAFLTNGTEKMRVGADGNVGIGTTSPVDPLSIGTLNASATRASLNVSNNALVGASALGTYIGGNPATASADFINYQVNGTTKFKVDKDGLITGDGSGLTGISAAPAGTSGLIQFNSGSSTMAADSALFWENSFKRLFVGGFGTNYTDVEHNVGPSYSGAVNAVRAGDDTVAPFHAAVTSTTNSKNMYSMIGLRRTSSAWSGGAAAISNGDYLPGIGFAGQSDSNHGTGMVLSGSILGVVDGTVSSGVLPTSLVFNTSATNASGLAERMRITSAGNVGIGTTSPTSPFQIVNTLPSAPSAAVSAMNMSVTGSGSAGFGQYGLKINLNSGYTGGSSSAAIHVQNDTGTGSGNGNVLSSGYNSSMGIYAKGNGNVANGVTYGIVGTAQNYGANGVSVGVAGGANNDPTPKTIGVFGSANAGTVVKIGGYFGLGDPSPSTLTSAGLISNNFATGSPSFIALDNGTAALTVANGGNVGIKTTSPGALLQLGTAGASLGTMRLTGNTSGYIQIQPAAAAGSWTMTLPPNAGTSGYVLQTDGAGVTSWVAQSGGGGSSSGTAGHIQYSNGSSGFSSDSNKFFWDATNDRLGIGTNTPSKELQIYGGNPALALTNTTFTDLRLFTDSSGGTLDAGGGAMVFNTGASVGFANAERMRILQTGEVGIGTSAPSAQMDISATNSNGTLRVYDRTATTGVTRTIVRAGAGQSTTNLLEIQDTGGAVTGFVNSAGYWLQPGTPTAATYQAATTNYVDSAVSSAGGAYLKKDGSVALTGTWGAGNQAINNVSTLSVGSSTAPTGGVAYFNGNVGIGTTSPSEKLHVVGNIIIPSGSTIKSVTGGDLLGFDGANVNLSPGNYDWRIGHPTDTNQVPRIMSAGAYGSKIITFSMNGVDRLRIDASGNVGIGTTTPATTLNISKADTNTGGVTHPLFIDHAFSSGTAANFSGTGLTLRSANTAGTQTHLFSMESYFVPATASAETSYTKFYSMNAGTKVEVASMSPNYFTLGDGNGNVAIQAHGNSYGSFINKVGAMYITNEANSVLTLGTNNTERVRILASGNVGIGTTSPAAKLDVAGQIRAAVFAASGTTIDWNNGNTQYLAGPGTDTAFTLNNLLDGGSYTLVLQGGAASTTTFSATGVSTWKFSPANAPSVASKDTTYNILRVGSTAYVSWISGF